MNNFDLKQALLLTYIFLNGLIFLWGISKTKVPWRWLFFSSFPVGCGLVGTALAVHIMTTLSYSLLLDLLILLLFSISFLLKRKRLTPLIKELLQLITCLFSFFVISSLFTISPPYISLSYDSIRQILMAFTMSLQGNGAGLDWSSWGSMLVSLHATAGIIGENYLSTLLPTFSFSLLGLFFIGIYDAAKNSQASKITAIIYALLFTAFILVVRNFWLHGFIYIHNNIISAGFLLCFIIWLIRHQERKEETDWSISLLFLVFFSLSRTENLIVTLIFTQMLLADIGTSKKMRKDLLIATLPSLIWLFWTSGRIMFHGAGTSILNSKTALSQIGLVLIFYLSNIGPPKRALNKHFNKIFLNAHYALATMIIGLLIFDQTKLGTSLNRIIRNIFNDFGQYQLAWYLLVPFSFISYSLTRNEFYKKLIGSIYLYFLLILLLSLFRNPYRIGFGDSSNRILLTHFLTLSYTIFYMYLSQALQWSRNLKIINTTLIMSIMVFISAFNWYSAIPNRKNFDLMTFCESINGQNFISWKHPISLKKVDRNYDFTNFAQADSKGEREITLNFDRKINASKIVLENVVMKNGDLFGLTDFELFLSIDGESWQSIIKTQRTPSDIKVVDTISFDSQEFRYIKLKGTKSNSWQNRFILKRISVYL